ncbi:hypothetical protein [Citrifermentans bremense]|uniref:hypothetical protein n=1 Tax=Citrifermentans bremense TaxID=60035 RepID=UPI00047ECF87|nr:hypothetical protein [Citrifermentans bremense]
MGEDNNHGGEAGSASTHVKLVSEGGVDAPEAQRARFWSPEQMVASCITPQQMDNFRAYNNVCMTLPTNDRYAFSVTMEHATKLDEGVIPESMLQEFEANATPLSQAARLKVQHAGRVWFILDLDKKYSVRMVPTRLLVYSETL